MTRWFIGLALLCACGPADSGGDPPAARPHVLLSLAVPTPAEVADDLSRVDARGTATSIRRVAESIRALSPERAAQAASALRFLTVNCPFTRSAMQLPFALHQAVMSVRADELDPLIQSDWIYLQQGLGMHVAVLQELGVDLALPQPGDQLHGHAPSVMLDHRALMAHDDPVLATSLLVDEITDLSLAIDAPAMQAIRAHSDRMEQATGVVRPCPRSPFSLRPGQPWTLGMQLGGWHDALRKVRPFIDDPAVQAKVDAMNSVLERFGAASHVTPSDLDG